MSPATSIAGMKVIMHIGMPKSGSTSFQCALMKHRSELAEKHRLAYIPDEGAINNHEIYYIIQNLDPVKINDYLFTKMLEAAENGCNTLLISAERLFTIDDCKDKFLTVKEILKRHLVDLELVLICRDIKKYLKSYITQLIYNASLTISNDALAEWTARQIEGFKQCGAALNLMDFDHLVDSKNLAEEILNTLGFSGTNISTPHENATPSRPTAYAILEGNIAKLHAVLSNEDVNSSLIDNIRTNIRDKYDSLDSKHIRLFQICSGEIDSLIEKYIDSSVLKMSEQSTTTYQKIKELKFISHNKNIDGEFNHIEKNLIISGRHCRLKKWLGMGNK